MVSAKSAISVINYLRAIFNPEYGMVHQDHYLLYDVCKKLFL